MPIAIQCRRAPRNPACAIVENFDRVYNSASCSPRSNEQEMCPASAMEKARGETILPCKSYRPRRPLENETCPGGAPQLRVALRLLRRSECRRGPRHGLCQRTWSGPREEPHTEIFT